MSSSLSLYIGPYIVAKEQLKRVVINNCSHHGVEDIDAYCRVCGKSKAARKSYTYMRVDPLIHNYTRNTSWEQHDFVFAPEILTNSVKITDDISVRTVIYLPNLYHDKLHLPAVDIDNDTTVVMSFKDIDSKKSLEAFAKVFKPEIDYCMNNYGAAVDFGLVKYYM